MPPLDPHPSPVTEIPHLLEVGLVAHKLSTSEEFVRRLIRQNKLAAVRLGKRWRVDAKDLRAFIMAQRIASQRNGEGE